MEDRHKHLVYLIIGVTPIVAEMSVIKDLTDIEHVLLRPGMYVGDTHVRSNRKFLLRGDTIVEDDIVFNSGLERIFLEVVYNAADNAERSKADGVDPGRIIISVKNDTVIVRNEGNPFPIGEEVNGRYDPERALGLLRSGSNFENSGRKVSGCNGVGASLTNIFSTVFDVDVGNHIEKKRMRLQWRSNMQKLAKRELSDYDGPSYTKITYIADFSRFYDDDVEFDCAGVRRYSDDMIDTFAKHCVDVALTTGVPIIFNGRTFNIPDIRTYATFIWPNLSGMNTLDLSTDDTQCLVVDTRAGRSFSFVNGIYVPGGGVHVDVWQKAITKPLLPALKKLGLTARSAYKSVFKAVSMIMVSRYPSIEFSEQVKDKLISPTPELPPMETKGLAKWEGIITMARRIKAIAATLENVSKKNDGKKSQMVNLNDLKDAERAGTSDSHSCTLYIVEGKSAKGFVVKAIDGEWEGALPVRGKFINVSKCDKESYEKNEEVRALHKALGLKEGTDYSDDKNFSQLRYARVVLLADNDPDGQHIIGLIFNFFRKRYPSLLEREKCFVHVMLTPLIKAVAGKKKFNFFSGSDYRRWCEENPNLKHSASYYKGLGSSTDEEIDEAFQLRRIVEYKWDEDAEAQMSMAFDNGSEDERKDWVMSWNPQIGRSHLSVSYHATSLSHFISHELCEFSYVTTQRCMPSLIDGLKEPQRKILAIAMKIDTPYSVSSLKGDVKSKMAYKYGDSSLYHTIVNMGDYYAGSNNIPLLQAHGQYNSRQGNVASQDRYIKASASPVLPFIFREEDTCILKYKYDDGSKIEPTHYYPIIPLFCINDTRALASGFAMAIPGHSPVDAIKYIAWWLKKYTGEDSVTPPPELKPYYFGYRGKMYKKNGSWYSEGSFEEVPSRKKIKDIRITELPVTLTIDNYLKKLDSMIEKSERKIEYKDTAKTINYKYKGNLRKEVIPNITISGFAPLTDDPMKELGLIEKIPVDSIVLLDENSIPRVYDHDLYAALSDFCLYRYQAYEKRRNILLSTWKEKASLLEKKKQYIQDVIDGRISFRGTDNKPKRKQMIIQEVRDRGYPEEFLKIATLSLCEEGLQAVDNEVEKFRVKIDKYENATPASLWREELKQLHTYLYSK